ncbi:hypothetical protein VHEMI09222 [[Torrubiella] hemipterigena]|uniref:Uncharacterized protein n=1 Tax=[Torrubiella] hemipterigena TaxID=1531966 RepID=A0A0A1T963_9HYPO|nr:hypothetical protein VHEMI09222 [[Torrubiella] hemipterigena]
MSNNAEPGPDGDLSPEKILLEDCITHLKATDPTECNNRHQQFNEWSDLEFKRCRLERDAARRYQAILILENKLHDEYKRQDDERELRKRDIIKFMEVFDRYYEALFNSSMLNLVCLHFGEDPNLLDWKTVLGQDDDLLEMDVRAELINIEADEEMAEAGEDKVEGAVLQEPEHLPVPKPINKLAFGFSRMDKVPQMTLMKPTKATSTPSRTPEPEKQLPVMPLPSGILAMLGEQDDSSLIGREPDPTTCEKPSALYMKPFAKTIQAITSSQSSTPNPEIPPTIAVHGPATSPSTTTALPMTPPKTPAVKVMKVSPLGKSSYVSASLASPKSDSIEYQSKRTLLFANQRPPKRRKRTQRKPLTDRTIPFAEVYDNGKAHHEITEFPPGSGHYYIFQCKVPGHDVSFSKPRTPKDGQLRRSAPIRSAGVHCGHRHGTDRSAKTAIREVGYCVTDCTPALKELNNAAFSARFWATYKCEDWPYDGVPKNMGKQTKDTSREETNEPSTATQGSTFTTTKRRVISTAEYFASRGAVSSPKRLETTNSVPETKTTEVANPEDSDDEPLVRLRLKRSDRYSMSATTNSEPLYQSRKGLILPNPNQPRLGQLAVTNGRSNEQTATTHLSIPTTSNTNSGPPLRL